MSTELNDVIGETIKELSSAETAPQPTTPEATVVEPVKEEEQKQVEPVSSEAPKAQAQEPVKDESTRESSKSDDKAPQSWSPAVREKWATLPEEVRKEIVRRETASIEGVRQLRDRYAPMEKFLTDMSPVFQVAKEVGAHPLQYVAGLVGTERTLRTGDARTKFNELVRLADTYGIPLREIIDRSVGEEILGKSAPQKQGPTVPPELDQRLSRIEQNMGQSVERQQMQMLQEFSRDKEFFGDVRTVMADLLDAGQASSLSDAYDKACWMTPSVRDVLISRRGQKDQQDEISRRQAAAAGLNLGGNKVSVPKSSEDDSLEDAVRASTMALAGRV